MHPLNLSQFITRHVTGREKSLFDNDWIANRPDMRKAIDGKSVLVIGGAGSIGSEFIKALLQFHPARLFVVDISENGLTELTRDLRSAGKYNIPADYLTYPVNFGDGVFEKILRQEGPFEVVANFAAHKHVRSEKDAYSIEAMVENNVIRAKKLLDLLVENPPEKFFCVSTDKASNPVNVMGATKKLMEELILTYANEIPVTTARFANVAFSNGSLLDGFLTRLHKNQPFSAPKGIKRYFVSPEEAGQLCLLACTTGQPADIFIPKMEEAEARAFTDIAVDLLHDLGYKVDYCSTEEEARDKAAQWLPNAKYYPVYFFDTDTSGEKPMEEFFTTGEEVLWEGRYGLGVIKGKATRSIDELNVFFTELELLFQQATTDKAMVVKMLEDFLPGFQHLEKGKHLDQRM